MSSRTNRRTKMVQGRLHSSTHDHPSVHRNQFTTPNATPVFDQTSSWNPRHYTTQDDVAHDSYGSFTAHPQLHLTVPGNRYYDPNDWMSTAAGPDVLSPSDTSPSSDPFSPSMDMDMSPPTYPFSDGVTSNQDFFKPYTVPEEVMRANAVVDDNAPYTVPVPVANTIDPGQLSAEAPSPPSYSGKQRSAHRKAIEEKSSIKRKNAEHRLSRAISTCLEGTFIPGLANQLNQAAEIIEKYQAKISELERENNDLRARLTPHNNRDFKVSPTYRTR